MALEWKGADDSENKFKSIQDHYTNNDSPHEGVDFSNFEHFPVNSDLVSEPKVE